jgi:hypothetical protein
MIYAAFPLTCLIGWLLLPSQMNFSSLPRLGLAFGAGAFAISLQMFAYDLLGIPWTRLSLLLPWSAAALFVVVRRKEQLALPPWSAPAWWQLALSAGLMIPVMAWLPLERIMPLTSQSWDAWAIWLFKAKAFYLDGGIGPYLERGGELANHPGYPLLVPLYGAFLYVLQGDVADQAAKFLSPCFLFALWGVFYGVARKFAPPLISLVFTLTLSTLPMLNIGAFALAGYADSALAAYVLAAAGFLCAWYRDGQTQDLAVASIAAAAAAWTKNEGQFFLLGLLVLAGMGLVRRKACWEAWAWLLAPPIITLAPWVIVRQVYGVEAAEFVPGVEFEASLFWTALQTLAAKAVDLNLFNLTFWVLLGSAVAAARINPPKAFWLLPGLTLWHVAGALLAYATGRNDLAWWLGTSADRILSQVAPLALLSGAIVFGAAIEPAQESPLARPETAGDRKPAQHSRKRRGAR